MEFLDMVYDWIVTYTIFNKDMGFWGFLIFSVPLLVSLHIIIMSFKYPFFPKNTTWKEAVEAAAKSNNHLGHKSLLVELFVGLGALGVCIPYFIPIFLLLVAFVLIFGIYGILRDFFKRLFG